MSRFPVIVMALFAAFGAVAAPADDAANNPLVRAGSRADVVRGSFRQEKYLAELDRPLVSSGRFLMVRDHGLIWEIERPFESTLIIGRQHMVQRVDGRQTLRLSRAEQPGLQVVAAVLMAVFQADLDRLRDFFDIRAVPGEGEGWHLVMQPTADSVTEFVERLTVHGTDGVERIEFEEPGGDRSLIRLQRTPDSGSPLTPQERREFAD